MADALFQHLERLHAGRPWGAVLDAGTGVHSLEWVLGLPSPRIAAVTGDAQTAAALRVRFAGRLRPADRLISGNWTDPTLLHGEVYDTVLADYLLGAIDGFAPYFQDQLFARLRPHVGGRLYAVGLAPYAEPALTPGGRIIAEIARLRDACILLAGHRCYREYPLDWVLRTLERSGYAIDDAHSFPIVYGARFVHGQLDVCVRKLPLLADRGVAAALDSAIAELRERAMRAVEAEGGIHYGEDWVVCATPCGT